MNKVLRGVIVVFGLACAPIAMSGAAHAAVGISFDLGNVAVGYQDGYWDRSHRWHSWQNQRDMNRYKAAHAKQYHNWKHNRDIHHRSHR